MHVGYALATAKAEIHRIEDDLLFMTDESFPKSDVIPQNEQRSAHREMLVRERDMLQTLVTYIEESR